MVRSLLEASPEAARQHDSDHWTPLHHAIEQDASLPVLGSLISIASTSTSTLESAAPTATPSAFCAVGPTGCLPRQTQTDES